MKQFLLFLFCHFVRPIFAKYLFKFISMIKIVIDLDKGNNTDLYNEKKKRWNSIKNFNDLVNWFKVEYKYQWDNIDEKKNGLFDHDNSEIEWLWQNGGDCDDGATYAKKKLRSFGIKADRIFIVGLEKGKLNPHFDCLYYNKDKVYLWNYSNIIESEKEVSSIIMLNKRWNNFWGNELLWCKCFSALEYIGGALTITFILSLIAFLVSLPIVWIYF